MKTTSRKGAEAQRWFDPKSAPLDGTMILGDFGFPWALPAVWDLYDEQWVVATVSASPMNDGPDNYWLEMDTEQKSAMKRWCPIPKLCASAPLREASSGVENKVVKDGGNGT